MNQLLTARHNIHLAGNGEKILFFIHGFGCNQLMWRHIVPAFEKDFTIVLIDLVGCGDSDEGAYDYIKYNSLNGYAEDVLEICEAFSFKEVVLIGHSVSAMIATLAVNKRPDIFKKLIMVCPSPRYINDENYTGGFNQTDIDEMIKVLSHNYLGWAVNIAPVIVGNSSKPGVTQELSKSFCNNNPAIASHFARVTFLGDNRPDIKNIKIETLVIQSRVDSIAPLQVGHYLHQNIPFSQLSIIETIGHTPHLCNPEVVIKAIKNFI